MHEAQCVMHEVRHTPQTHCTDDSCTSATKWCIERRQDLKWCENEEICITADEGGGYCILREGKSRKRINILGPDV